MLISDEIIRFFAISGQYCLAAGFFAEHPVLGYVVTGILATALGVLFTVFCSRVRDHMEEKDKDNDRKH